MCYGNRTLRALKGEKTTFLSHDVKTEGHPLTLNAERFMTARRKLFVAQHIVQLWNSWLVVVLIKNNINVFGRGLDSFIEDQAVKSYQY